MVDTKLLKEHLARIQKRVISEQFDKATAVKNLKALVKITDDKKMLMSLRDLQNTIKKDSSVNSIKKQKVLKNLTELGEAILSGDNSDAEILMIDLEKQLKSL